MELLRFNIEFFDAKYKQNPLGFSGLVEVGLHAFNGVDARGVAPVTVVIHAVAEDVAVFYI